MKEENIIRLLKADEIEVRVGAIYKKGITLLLYKNARVDMTILDEVFGTLGWKRRHYMAGDGLFCEVSIRDEGTGEWIAKSDVGTPSYAEPLKGASSDSFKRACTNVGIGRELYTAPFIWIPRDKVEFKEENGRETVKDKFTVQSITYDEAERKITGLVICNGKNQVVFQHMEYSKKPAQTPVRITDEQNRQLLDELKRTGYSINSVLKKHNLSKLSDMSPELWKSAMETLECLATKVA